MPLSLRQTASIMFSSPSLVFLSLLIWAACWPFNDASGRVELSCAELIRCNDGKGPTSQCDAIGLNFASVGSSVDCQPKDLRLVLTQCNNDTVSKALSSQCLPQNLVSLKLTQSIFSSLQNVSVRAFTRLEYLELAHTSLRSLGPFTFQGLSVLKTLDLTNNLIDDLPPSCFENLNALESLNLDYNSIASLHDEVFKHLPALQTLSLQHNEITNLAFLSNVSLPHLKEFRASFNHIQQLSTLPKSIEQLFLASNEISSVDNTSISGMTTLKTLDLSSNSIGVIAKSAFQNQHNLQRLDLSHNKIGHLPSLFPKNSSLQVLKLDHNDLAEVPTKALSVLTKLERLYLDSNNISALNDTAFDRLASLKTLSLHLNNIVNVSLTAFKGLSLLTSLKLSENNIQTLHRPLLQQLTSLTTLDVAENRISAIEADAFSSLASLQKLDLSSNRISSLGNGLFNGLHNLTSLKLAANSFTVVPSKAFQQLTSLEVLVLSQGRLATVELDAFKHLTRLGRLDMSSSEVSSLPSTAFTQLSELQILDLSGNHLRSCSAELFNSLIKLEKLLLFDNNLTTLPPTLFHQLTSLTDLDISQNRLDAISFSNNTQLINLNLARNHIKSLPPSNLKELRELKTLYLSKNGLTQFEIEKGSDLPQLEHLDLEYNRISSLSINAAMPSLARLDASHNNVSVIGRRTLSEMTSLQFLDLSNNDIESIDSKALRTLTLLRAFDISHNPLLFLPDGLFHTQSSLATLNAAFTRLSRLTNETFDGLGMVHHIDVSNCRLINIDNKDVFKNTTNLETLDLSDNSLTSLEPDVFAPLQYVRQFTLSRNSLTSLDSALLTHMTSLELLDISNNQLQKLPESLLEPLHRLVELSVSNNQLSELSISFVSQTRLRKLNAAHNKIERLETAVLSPLEPLTMLDLSNNSLVNIRNTTLEGLTSLSRLDFSHNAIQTIADKALESLSQLTYLNLGDNKLKSLEHGSFATLYQLKELYLNRNQISVLPSRLMNASRHLRVVDLSHNNMTTWSPTSMNLTVSLNLDRLDLRGNPFKKVSVPAAENVYGSGLLVDLGEMELRNPNLLNRMGLPGPLFVVPHSSKISCSLKSSKTEDNGVDLIKTTCSCQHPYVLRNGQCYDPSNLYLALQIGGSLAAGALIGIVVTVLMRKSQERRARLQHSLELQQQLLSEKERDIEALRSAWQIDNTEVELQTQLGYGAFGEVWKATWGGLTVALKLLHQAIAVLDETAVQEFTGEVEFLMRCRHTNIVRFFGAGQRDGLPFLVMEYMSGGSLKNYLRDVGKPLTWSMRVRFAREIAAGLAHIHSLGQLHRDIKTDNILLDEHLICKVADFGTVKQIVQKSSERHRYRTIRSFSRPRRSNDEYRRTSASSFVSGVLGFFRRQIQSGRSASYSAMADSGNAAAVGSSYGRRAVSASQLQRPLLSDADDAAELFSLDAAASDSGDQHSTTSGSGSRRSVGSALSDLLHGEAADDALGAAGQSDTLMAANFAHMTIAKGTPVYMAPEVIRGHAYAFSADVFSFGVVLWEIATRRVPDLLDECGLAGRGGPFMTNLLNALDDGLRLPVPTPAEEEDTGETSDNSSRTSVQTWPADYTWVMQQCWQQVPKLRPSMAMALSVLASVELGEDDDEPADALPAQVNVDFVRKRAETHC